MTMSEFDQHEYRDLHDTSLTIVHLLQFIVNGWEWWTLKQEYSHALKVGWEYSLYTLYAQKKHVYRF